MTVFVVEGHRTMSAKRASIAQMMLVVALVGMNLGTVCALPSDVTRFSTTWIFMGAIDFLIFWKLILARSLRAFQYMFLVVLVMAWIALANLVATERFHPLSLLVRWYPQVAKGNSIGIPLGPIDIGEFWVTCSLSLALASGAGSVAAWLEKRRNWDIAAFFRGAFVGFAVANLLALLVGAARGWEVIPQRHWLGRLIVVASCVLAGGLMGLSKLKSTPLVHDNLSS